MGGAGGGRHCDASHPGQRGRLWGRRWDGDWDGGVGGWDRVDLHEQPLPGLGAAKAQKDGIAWSAEYDSTRSHLCTRLVPELGFLRVLEVSYVFLNLSKTLHPLPATLYFADNFRGLQTPYPTLCFSWELSLLEGAAFQM